MVIEIQTRPNAGIPFGFADGILLLDLEFTYVHICSVCSDHDMRIPWHFKASTETGLAEMQRSAEHDHHDQTTKPAHG